MNSRFVWDDLVLPQSETATLRAIASQLRTTINERGGPGISALFAGSVGTGKTMAAQVLAGDLNLALYRIDLSSLVSKYIGETEKNLRGVFEAAEQGGAILLFDEADALFGKRGEVEDSHDRYANIEVGFLLQQMEAFRGLTILTSNGTAPLDPALLRCLTFVVQFPFPQLTTG
jgi:SpoVK/Ycf46/Vps4 family AAA+-type ATPase